MQWSCLLRPLASAESLDHLDGLRAFNDALLVPGPMCVVHVLVICVCVMVSRNSKKGVLQLMGKQRAKLRLLDACMMTRKRAALECKGHAYIAVTCKC